MADQGVLGARSGCLAMWVDSYLLPLVDWLFVRQIDLMEVSERTLEDLQPSIHVKPMLRSKNTPIGGCRRLHSSGSRYSCLGFCTPPTCKW